MTFDICEFVMFPLTVSSTVMPLSDIALTTSPVGDEIGVNVGVGISEGVAVGGSVGVGVSVGSGVNVWVGVWVVKGLLIDNTPKVETVKANAITVRMSAVGFAAFAFTVYYPPNCFHLDC